MEEVRNNFSFFKHSNKIEIIIVLQWSNKEQDDFENDFKKYIKKNKLKEASLEAIKDFLYKYPQHTDTIKELHLE